MYLQFFMEIPNLVSELKSDIDSPSTGATSSCNRQEIQLYISTPKQKNIRGNHILLCCHSEKECVMRIFILIA